MKDGVQCTIGALKSHQLVFKTLFQPERQTEARSEDCAPKLQTLGQKKQQHELTIGHLVKKMTIQLLASSGTLTAILAFIA